MTKFNLNSNEVKRILMLHENHNPNKNLIKEAYTLKVSSRGGWNSGAAPSNMSINNVTITSNNYDFIKGKIYYDKSEFAVKFDCKRPSTMEIIENGTGSISNQISGSKYTADASLTSFIKQKCVKPKKEEPKKEEPAKEEEPVKKEEPTQKTAQEISDEQCSLDCNQRYPYYSVVCDGGNWKNTLNSWISEKGGGNDKSTYKDLRTSWCSGWRPGQTQKNLVDFIVPVFSDSTTTTTTVQQNNQPTVY
jgi:hypothetical protein